jgi:diguanylate cyclase (GGDEF)-like protein/PAS domain S-box-containing protein
LSRNVKYPSGFSTILFALIPLNRTNLPANKYLRMPTVAELMSHHADRVAPSATVAEAAQLMVGAKISSVIVVDRNQVVGIVTEGDMMHAMRQHSDRSLPITAIMTAPVHTISADCDFREAYRDAARHGIRHLVVADAQGAPLGVVAETDIRRHLGLEFFRQLNNVDALMERNFPRLPASATLEEALTAMEAVRLTCVVVVDGKTPVGIVTEGDVVRLYLNDKGNPTLGEVMTAPIATIVSDSALTDAAQRMLDSGFRHLAVVDRNHHLIGLLTEHSLMRPLEMDLLDDALADRISNENTLSHNERYQRALLDNFPFLVWLKDTESRFLTVNRHFAEAVNAPNCEALIGHNDLDYFPPDLALRFRADDSAVMASGEKKNVVEQITQNGQRIWHETYKAPVRNSAGQIMGTVGFARDISHSKRAEEATLMRNAALAGLLRGERLENLLELIALSAEAELPGLRCSILLVADDGQHLRLGAAPSLSEAAQKALDGIAIAEGVGVSGSAAFRQSRVEVQNIFTDPKGLAFRQFAQENGVLAGWAEPIFGPNGELLGTFAAYHAEEFSASHEQQAQLAAMIISHQQNANRLEASLSTFHGIFNSIREALFIIASDGKCLDVNFGAEKLSGFPRQKMIGQHYSKLGAPGLNDFEQINLSIAKTISGTPETFEFWAHDVTGRIFPTSLKLHASVYFGQHIVIASVVDISESKAAAQRLEIENDLAKALASGAQRDELLSTMLAIALRYPEFDSGGIYWQTPDHGYQLIRQHGLSPAFIEQVQTYAEHSAQSEIIRKGEVVCSCCEGIEHCTDLGLISQEHLVAEDILCLLILPIVVDGKSVASINLAGKQTRKISHGSFVALQTLGAHFAQALRHLNAQEEAKHLQQNLSGLFNSLRDFLFIIDQQGNIVHHNQAVSELLGYTPGALIGQPIVTVHPPEARIFAQQVVSEMLAGKRNTCPIPILRADGQQLMVETRVEMGYWNGEPAIFGISQDISQRLLAEERQRLATSVFDNAHEGIMITDAHGIIIEINTTFSELTGYSREEAVGHAADLLKSGHHDADFYKTMWATIRSVGFWRGEVWNRKKSGEIFVELLTISSVRNPSDEITHFVAIFADITLIKQHQQRLEHLAHFDALTQLPNRILLADRLQLAMAQTERDKKMLAVCYLDLDGFKPVNDEHGHAAGDRLLIEVAQRLRQCVRAGDTVSRLGGDEFVLLFAGISDVHECSHAASRVLAALSTPFAISGTSIAISASIGVTLYPTDGSDADTLLRHADQAMYTAKQAGRNRFHLFDPESDRRARARRDEVSRIRQGLIEGEFVLHYQPKVNMREGRVLGAEALIRWQHPEQGLLAPNQFLPAIEGSDVDILVGEWVLEEALTQLEQWQSEGLKMVLSVNISGAHLQSPTFVEKLGKLLAAHPLIAPESLELEILETAALDDMAMAADIFVACRRLGVSFALDDFGTGYSSLTYFRRLPADTLKIDQSFVRDMLDDPDDLAIVEGVIGLTKAFGRKVIAEGVESAEHGMVLLQLGCDLAQGYGIARPMPGADFPAWTKVFIPDELWSSIAAFKWAREDLPMLVAEIDHTRWMRKLETYLADHSGLLSAPTQNHHSCRFGRWYYGPASQRYAELESYINIESVHARVHQLGNELIELKKAGEHTLLATRFEELHTTSSVLTEHIQMIQAEVLLSTQMQRH